VRESKIRDADVFVFVGYTPKIDGVRKGFDEDYVVIPQQEMMDLCKNKRTSKRKYNFYIIHDRENVSENRDNRRVPIDLSRFRRARSLI
jgi:hypothetical protein